LSIEVLEEFIHATVQAVFVGTASSSVPVTEIEVAEKWIVYEALEDDAHETCCSHVIHATKPRYFAGRCCGAQGHKLGVFFCCLSEKLIMLPLPT
jgi:hypothetical protein